MRPELIKIWGKIDAIDEKALYMDKKVEEKNKQISYVMDQLKESNFSKLDERLKAQQTELYANIK